jgi:hypothetical protein
MDRYLTTKEATEFLEKHSGIKFKGTTLGQMRFRKIGPRWLTLGTGRRVFYLESDLLLYLRGTTHHTSDSLSRVEVATRGVDQG